MCVCIILKADLLVYLTDTHYFIRFVQIYIVSKSVFGLGLLATFVQSVGEMHSGSYMHFNPVQTKYILK